MKQTPFTDDHQEPALPPPASAALAKRADSALSPHLVEPIGDNEAAEDEINLLDLWRVIAKRKWTIFVFFLIVLTAVVTATFLMTPIYRATLTLQIERETAKVVEFQAVTPTETANDWEFYQTQYELLQSRSLAQRVIEQLNLANNPIFMGEEEQPPLWEPAITWIKDQFTSASESAEPPPEPDLISYFLGFLTVEPVPDSRLVKLHFDSPDPELAARIVNKLADVFINLNLERRFDATSYAKKYLQERLQQIKAKLEDSEREIVAYARKEQIINIDERQSIASKTLSELTGALGKAEAKRMEAQSQHGQTQGPRNEGLTQILDNEVIQDFKTLKTRLEADYQEGLKIYKPAYPKMRQLASQIAEVQSKIDAEIANVHAALRADYDAASNNEGLLRRRMEEVKKEMLELQSRSIEYNILQREVDTNRELYEGLLQRFKEVGVAGGVGTNNVTIIDPAEVPREPAKPNLKLNVLLAMFLGLFGGIGLAFLFEHLDDTIKGAEDFERHIRIPVLGVIPLEKRKRGEQAKDQPALALSTQADPRSAFAESYRSTRTALQFTTSEGAPKCLVVTSAGPGEGKSTTVLSLAIHFAQVGKKVLLIDCDLRKPSVHRDLKLENSQGLTSYLAGAATPSEITRPTTIANLFAITSGALPPNPAELLSSAKMLSLLSLAGDKFDQILIDAPPVLGLADSLILGNLADGAVLVVEAGNARRSHVQGAVKRLRSARTHLLGGILTKLEAGKGSYGYYHSYYYYYNEDTERKRLTA